MQSRFGRTNRAPGAIVVFIPPFKNGNAVSVVAVELIGELYDLDAVNYTLKIWARLTRFLDDAASPLDNSTTDRAFRRPVR